MGAGFVHYCVFCGAHRPAESETMLEPSCAECGCAMRACGAEEYPRIAAGLRDQREPVRARLDGAGPLALMVCVPFLMPLLGVEVRDVIFLVPLVFLVLGAATASAASRRRGEPATAWRAYALSAVVAAGAVGVATLLAVAGASTTPAYHLGGVASVAMTAGLLAHIWPRLRRAQAERVLDAVQLLLVVAAATIYFVVAPGLASGHRILTLLVAIGLLGFLLAGVLTACGRRAQDRRVARWLWAMASAALLAHALIAAEAVHGLAGVPAPEIASVLLALQGWLLAKAAAVERPLPQRGDEDPDERTEWRWWTARIGLPTVQVVAFPLLVAWAFAVDGPGTWPIAWFGATFVACVVAAFARQAYLVVDHRRAVVEERRQRRRAQRRNTELEALTGLATTMTQTLEEAPIVEQALTVLHTAARATSSALHVAEDDRRRLRAAAGNWQSEQVWADGLAGGGEVERTVRGRRQVTRIALAARGSHIGWVTLVRPQEDPLTDRELELLRLLVDQMAIAVQNARDYREKLEQAVRDPLTGVYNRRYFFEALEKEVQRSRRYGSQAALVLVDADDFKRVNDTRGHSVGDDVLRGIAQIAAGLLRPADSLARIGGEEFALLLPETSRMDALAVAERLRAAVARAEIVPGLQMTVSAGVGACPQDAPTREDLVRRTDAALYWAKRNGKDMCALVDDRTDGALELEPAPARLDERVLSAAEAFAARVADGAPVPDALADLRRALQL
ncbi:MAG TPA: GGDEF domain-containing protein [Solirubrobacteraceae bacterium]|nr:GGDEF domain-containing protein [Solirubrobacteraceae bacterium]